MDPAPPADRATHPELTPEHAVALLRAHGFEVGVWQRATRTVLDTFDGRLNAAGLRLEHQHGPRRQLVLTAAGSMPASISIESTPRWVTDLPRGPFRGRLAPVIEMRALLALITFTDSYVPIVGRDGAGKTVVALTVHEAIGGVPWSVEVVQQPGHEKHFLRVHELLAEQCFHALPGDTAGAVLAANHIDVRGHQSSPTVPLDRDAPAFEGFRDVFINLAGEVRANWQGTIDDIDTEFLHDLRVGLRRTRSILSQSKKVLPDSLRDRFSDQFRWLAGLTGPTRDLDVYILEWDGYTAGLDESTRRALDPVLEHLRQHRERARGKLVAALQAPQATAMIESWTAALSTLTPDDVESPRARSPLGKVVATRVQRAHSTVIDLGRSISGDSPAEDLHELRKDAKRLRYIVECFASLLPEPTRKSFVKQLKGLQDNLGEHQDADVHAVEIRRVASELNDEHAGRETLVALGQLSEQLQATKRAAREEFADRFHEYDSKSTKRVVNEMLRALEP